MLLFGMDQEIRKWVGQEVGVNDFGPSTAIGVIRDNTIIAGAVFHNFVWPNIEISFASTSPRWSSKEAVEGILKYPFVQLNCRRLTSITRPTNLPTRAFLTRLGFELEGFHPQMFPDGDAMSFGFLRKNCRWIKEEFRLG